MSTVVILSGMDRPGITQALFEQLAALEIRHAISDMEQVVIHGHLILTLALEIAPENRESVLTSLAEYSVSRGLELRAQEGDHQSIERSASDSTVHITVMGRELSARPLGRVAAIVSAAGGNIERIFRIAHYPVTAIELLVSNVAVDAIKTSLAEVANSTEVDIGVQAEVCNAGPKNWWFWMLIRL